MERQVANELTRESRTPAESQPQQRLLDAGAPGRAESCNRKRKEEEKMTQKLLGRMRAAIATEEDFQDPDPGRQIWCEKEAAAHSLYSRRLQVVSKLTALHQT